MYLGMLLCLVGWCFYLDSVWALPGPVLFVAAMNRFQIGPEERHLRAKFGAAYASYCTRVRRWL